ncbi:hypothetical protein [Microvirga aerophila]|nr:hypothetical protein [Microvirga aerophila]
MSFMNWQYSRVFNTHVTLTFSKMCIGDHREAARLMPHWNKEMKRWLAIGPDKSRKRWKKRVRAAEPSPHLWVYVFENGRDKGFHAHQLCCVPDSQVKAFEAHTLAWWRREAWIDFPADAIEVRHCRTYDEKSGYERQVEWFRYLIKSAARDFGYFGLDGQVHSVDEIFKLAPYWETNPVYSPRLHGICHELSMKKRREAGFVSKLGSCELDEVYSGWEFDARRERIKAEETAAFLATLNI